MLVEATCSKCKNKFMMDEELYIHRKTHGSKINCPDCLEKSKKLKYEKASMSHKAKWANYTDAERAARIANAVNGIHAMTDDAKSARSLHSSIVTKRIMAELSDEERSLRSSKLSKSNKLRYSKMSKKEITALGKKISEGQRNIPKIKRDAINKQRSKSLKAYIKSLSDEERVSRNKRVQQWWDNMSSEEYAAWSLAQANGYSAYMDSLCIMPNKNESDFINYLNMHFIDYKFQYPNNTKHEDFDKMFPMNPVTGSKFVSPFHKWDFLLKTVDGDILVDVDGSIHAVPSYTTTHPTTNVTYNMLDYHQFNDSQRTYQTDGLPAYVIQCYNDNLNDNTNVVNVITNKSMTFKQFMSFLHWSNLMNEEKQENLNLLYDTPDCHAKSS